MSVRAPDAAQGAPSRTAPLPRPDPDPPASGAASPPRGHPADRGTAVHARQKWMQHADVAVAGALIVVAGLARLLPPGALRITLTLPVLLIVPGYLLVQALRPSASWRTQDLVLGLGFSLPVVGLAALLAAAFPGGFTAGGITAVLTLSCLALGVLAVIRRRGLAYASPSHHAVPAE